MNEYEAKQEARRERYRKRAGKASQEAERRSQAAQGIADGIPPGQPILVGHHSEKRHRRDLDKIDRNMRASIDAGKKAEHYAHKAAAVGTGGISSDEPEAVAKLKTRLAKLEADQAWMKTLNKTWRAFAKAPTSPATARLMEALSPIDRATVEVYKPQYSWERGPAASYQLSNNSAEIRRVKKRIAALEAQAAAEPAEPIRGDGFEIIENVEANRVQIIFDSKPKADVRAMLKCHGFRWSPTQGAWQRHLNAAGRMHAGFVREKLTVETP